MGRTGGSHSLALPPLPCPACDAAGAPCQLAPQCAGVGRVSPASSAGVATVSAGGACSGRPQARVVRARRCPIPRSRGDGKGGPHALAPTQNRLPWSPPTPPPGPRRLGARPALARCVPSSPRAPLARLAGCCVSGGVPRCSEPPIWCPEGLAARRVAARCHCRVCALVRAPRLTRACCQRLQVPKQAFRARGAV